jgi:PRC-barrel domain
MRATDLLGCRVYDSTGTRLGTVHDLGFETRGDTRAGTWSCRLSRLACGTVSFGHHLGYGAGDMAGPWPLTSIFGALRRHSVEIDWTDVVSVRPNRIEVRKTRDELRRKVRKA